MKIPPTTPHQLRERKKLSIPLLLSLGVAFGSLPALACAWADAGGAPTSLQMSNAYWNCPTRTPRPTVTAIPTVCAEATGTPNPAGTPGPIEPLCEEPQPTATPWPTLTPYGRWLSPQDRGSSNTFYRGQKVRVGKLKLSLESYTRTAPIQSTGGQVAQVAHVFTFSAHNEGTEALNIQWPLQTFVREVQHEQDGTLTAGNWWQTWRSEGAAGLPRWNPAMGDIAGGERRRVVVAIEAPQGEAHAVGFAPDPTGGERRDSLGNTVHILWFVPHEDPYCPAENTAGPSIQGDGGAVYPKPLPGTPIAQYGYFTGWPVLRGSAEVHLTQGFGCTDFPELSGYDCPNDKPWFHSGIDLAAARGTPLLSVMEGIVTYVGPSSGARECLFPGAERPRYNLGWMVQARVMDAGGHLGPYTVKYGHAVVGSERVQVGDHVQPGQALALMGSTGCSTGPHLHFMVQNESGRFLDPFNFIGSPRR